MVKVFAVAVLALLLGFVAGAWWHAELALEPPSGPAVAPIALPREPVAPCPAVPPTAPTAAPAGEAAAACPEVAAALGATREELTSARAELQRRDEQRTAKEGTPIPAASRKRDPRHEPEALRTAVSDAFTQVKVPGRVDGLDCTEWPCIVYGRIRGTEDELEKLEGAKALAAYEGDVLSVLLWVVTDEAAHEAPLPVLPGRPEQTLFAFAWYPRGLERALAENLDRRVRSRTADLWNTMSPSDETGR